MSEDMPATVAEVRAAAAALERALREHDAFAAQVTSPDNLLPWKAIEGLPVWAAAARALLPPLERAMRRLERLETPDGGAP